MMKPKLKLQDNLRINDSENTTNTTTRDAVKAIRREIFKPLNN